MERIRKGTDRSEADMAGKAANGGSGKAGMRSLASPADEAARKCRFTNAGNAGRCGKDDSMSVIVKAAACMLAIPVTIMGLYVMAHGHLTPGGGFAGGAVAATLIPLFIVAGGMGAAQAVRKDLLSVLEALGLVSFGTLAFLGIGATFFRNALANSSLPFGMRVAFGANPGYMNTAGVLPLMNYAVGLEVFAALSLVALYMFSYDASRKEREEE